MIDDQQDDFAPDAYARPREAQPPAPARPVSVDSLTQSGGLGFSSSSLEIDVGVASPLEGLPNLEKLLDEFEDAVRSHTTGSGPKERQRLEKPFFAAREELWSAILKISEAETAIRGKYVAERRRVKELRKHLRNTTRLMVAERGWVSTAFRDRREAAQREQEWRDKYFNRVKMFPNVAHDVKPMVWVPVIAFLFGAMAGVGIEMLFR